MLKGEMWGLVLGLVVVCGGASGNGRRNVGAAAIEGVWAFDLDVAAIIGGVGVEGAGAVGAVVCVRNGRRERQWYAQPGPKARKPQQPSPKSLSRDEP